MKLGLVSLGCDKNTVDSERMLSALAGHGAVHTRDLSEAEVILVNTCGFIDAAKEESIETLLQMGRLKESGDCRAVVAVGCLVEQYRDELVSSLPEVDLFVGLRDMESLVPELEKRGLLEPDAEPHPGERLALTDRRHVRYLKVSEGCDHGCAFCAIPLWRGKHRSFEADRLVAEAQRLEGQGAVELNLVAQDLAHYGRDIRDGTDIASLVRRLLDETDIAWFRLLYIYSAGLREPLVDLMATERRLLPYLDMPIQHASDPVLQRMRRPERQDRLREKIGWLRSSIPDLTLRTTVLVGFPGETDGDFRDLLEFIEDVEFDRLGAFAFSPQDGTRAMELEADFLPDGLGSERLEELLELQRGISADRLAGMVGRRVEALVDEGGESAVARTWGQADDVDGVTVLESANGLAPGAIVEAEVVDSDDYDLRASVLRTLKPALPATQQERRVLPVLPMGLDAVWGR
ncbi:MAG: 30S ribosomal protein S12 methylthiotransferase RimO [marine benthic group bacterium]|nr:30S ribosomal protein S12 methylthiotransferase RimO [Candidatus Benthicola marisminoris]